MRLARIRLTPWERTATTRSPEKEEKQSEAKNEARRFSFSLPQAKKEREVNDKEQWFYLLNKTKQ